MARLDKSQSNTAGDVHIVISISDLDLPPVKELKPGIYFLLNVSIDPFTIILQGLENLVYTVLACYSPRQLKLAH